MNLFARGAAGLNLSPMERAVLRFCEGLIVSALITALPVIAQLLASELNAGAVDWRQTGTLAVACVAFAFLMALSKWAKAHADQPLAAPLGDLAAQAANAVASAGGLSSEVKSELSPDGQPNTPDSGPLGNPIMPGS